MLLENMSHQFMRSKKTKIKSNAPVQYVRSLLQLRAHSVHKTGDEVSLTQEHELLQREKMC